MKQLTILHTNDMHGDFLPEDMNGIQTGGLKRLSGYVQKTRKENPNTIYAMAGDMFRGSVIDSEYLGLSTIDMVNIMNPDISCIGNHEVDYGIAHLLFLEKCATFPIINANLFITMNNARLFSPCKTIHVDGMNIMFIGILTDEVISSTKTEKVIGSFIDIEEAAKEIGVICDNYKTVDIDVTILLTHIGIEEDRKLAKLLDPDWGIDLIIGGHSHTFMNEPEIVNNIPIVQAGYGTDQIGRFDLIIDDENNRIEKWEWECIPINEHTAPEDPNIQELINHYKDVTDSKYGRIITNLNRKLTHPCRTQETELGNLYADIMQDESSFDIMLFGSGSIRKEEFGPLVTYADLIENTPFDDKVYMVTVTGEQFKKMVLHILRDEAWNGHTEFYQFSKGVHIVYKKSTHELLEFDFNNQPITPDMRLKIALQNYHFINFNEFFGIPFKEVEQNAKPVVVVTSVNNIIEEYMSTHPRLDAHVEGRLVILD